MYNDSKSSPSASEPKVYVPLIKQILRDHYKPAEMIRKGKSKTNGVQGENPMQIKLRDIKEVKDLIEPGDNSEALMNAEYEESKTHVQKEKHLIINPPVEISPGRDKSAIAHLSRENSMLRKVLRSVSV
jgi:hypothetical protein